VHEHAELAERRVEEEDEDLVEEREGGEGRVDGRHAGFVPLLALAVEDYDLGFWVGVCELGAEEGGRDVGGGLEVQG
jgi:hypothetical protein